MAKHFKNLAVLATQDFKKMLGHFDIMHESVQRKNILVFWNLRISEANIINGLKLLEQS